MESYKVLYNTRFGGFHLSDKFCKLFQDQYAETLNAYIPYWSKQRSDPRIVDLFEQRRTRETDIGIEKIPKGCEYMISEYDGKEKVGWDLPKDIMLEDLRKVYIGELARDDTHPLTQQWLDSRKPLKDFYEDFCNRFYGRKTHVISLTHQAHA